MSMTNINDATAERLVAELFEEQIVYVPYVRPGFPLARSVSGIAARIPPGSIGLALAHHGLVIWGDDAEQCHTRLTTAVARVDEYLERCRRGRRVMGPATRPRRPPTPAAALRKPSCRRCVARSAHRTG